MKKHIPDTLPIRGKKVKIAYPGIPLLCYKCWKLGHGHWECPDEYKTNWLELVADFFADERVSEEMLGSWIDLLYKFHPAFNTPLDQPQQNPEDLRRQIPRRFELPNDARNQLIQGRQPPAQLQHQQRPQRGQFRGRNNRGYFIPPTTLQLPDPSQAHLYYQPQHSQQFRPRPQRSRGEPRGGRQPPHGLFRGNNNVRQQHMPQPQYYQPDFHMNSFQYQ